MSLQTHGIQPVEPGTRRAGRQNVWRDILCHRSHASHKGIIPNPRKLMNAWKRAEDCSITHRDMTAKARSIGKDDLSACETIMGNMDIGHQEILFTNLSDSAA